MSGFDVQHVNVRSLGMNTLRRDTHLPTMWITAVRMPSVIDVDAVREIEFVELVGYALHDWTVDSYVH